ncbi:hypothetical protein ACFX13_009052 [Malus domestica]
MGKGGGCVPSKKKVLSDAAPIPDTANNASRSPALAYTDGTPSSATKPNNVSIVIESHPNPSMITKLRIFVVFYSMYGHVEELTKRMKKGVDGMEGTFGSMTVQMKAFFYSTRQLWNEQTLARKPGGFFVSTGTQGGNQETTL